MNPLPGTTGPWPKWGWKPGERLAVAELVTLVFIGVPTVEVESVVKISGMPESRTSGPGPKSKMGTTDSPKKANTLEEAGVVVGDCPAIAVNVPATLVYSGPKEGVLTAVLAGF